MFQCAAPTVKFDALLTTAGVRPIDPDDFSPTEADLETIDAASDGAGSDWWESLEAEADATEMAARADEAADELEQERWAYRMPRPIDPDFRPAA